MHKLYRNEIQEQMLVNDYEAAIFYKNGQFLGKLNPGKHDLRPVLRRIPGIKRIANRLSDLELEIIYVYASDFKVPWGGGGWLTTDAVTIGGNGELHVRIQEPHIFLQRVVGGGKNDFTSKDLQREMVKTIQTVVRPEVHKVEVFQIFSKDKTFTDSLLSSLKTRIIGQWGLELLDLNDQWGIPDHIRKELEQRRFGETTFQRERGRKRDLGDDDFIQKRRDIELETLRLQGLRQAGVDTSEHLVLNKLDSGGTKEVWKEKAKKPFSQVTHLQQNTTRIGNETHTINAPIQDSVIQNRNVVVGGSVCSHCSSTVQTGWKACPACGNSLPISCPHCGNEVQADWKACPACGNRM